MQEFTEQEIQKIIEEYFHSLLMFHHACGKEILNENNLPKLLAALEITTDVPIIFAGLVHSLAFEEPQYFFNKSVMNEIYNNLSELNDKNENKFFDGLIDSQQEFFAAINSYINIIEIFSDLNEASYENEFKTKIFRNPIYVQICEDCIMNFYRCFLSVLDSITGKNYKAQNTLGKAIPLLKKFKFKECTEVDIDIRNSINHGNVAIYENEILFKYQKAGVYKVKSVDVWHFDDIINIALDIAGGIIAGFVKFYSLNPTVLTSIMLADIDEEFKFEWFKLFYKTNNTRILFITKASLKEDQINITVQTTIPDRTKLIFALTEIAKGAYHQFPNYDRYFIGYKHDRSINGFISIYKSDFESFNSFQIDNAKLISKVIEKQELMVWDIQDEKVDERAFKFHIFPKIRGDNWHLSKIEDCSIENYKRIKANIIIEEKESVNHIKFIINQVITHLKNIKNPQNPYIKIPFGEIEADAIFLHVFFKSKERKGFTLFINNPNFICLAHYYKNEKVPKIKHGGVPESLWFQYRKEKLKRIELAWNPKFKKNKKVEG